jgi:hypothetical protein
MISRQSLSLMESLLATPNTLRFLDKNHHNILQSLHEDSCNPSFWQKGHLASQLEQLIIKLMGSRSIKALSLMVELLAVILKLV